MRMGKSNMGEPRELLQPVHLISVGAFGRAVARYVKAFCEDVLETVVVGDNVPVHEAWPLSRVNVVAACRPVPHLCELLDQIAFEHRRPFIPLVLDSTVLQLGPIVLPGASCWACWVQRLLQHATWSSELSALLQYYSSNGSQGPVGYLEPFAVMGASQVVQAVDALDQSSAIPGYIWQFDVVRRNIMTSTVVGVHNCPRCGLHRSEATRSYAEIQAELAYLWQHPAGRE